MQAKIIFSLLVLTVLLPMLAFSVEPTNAIRGVVKDEDGKPLAGVKVQMCGIKEFRDGAWQRKLTLGEMPFAATDAEGRFMVPLDNSALRYDFYFDKPGYAPAFLDTVAHGSELNITLKRGQTLVGTVKKIVNGRLEPVVGAPVDLRLPTDDLWFQQRTMTGPNGAYIFHVTPPAGGKTWQIVYAGEVVSVPVQEGQPAQGPDFEVTVNVKNR